MLQELEAAPSYVLYMSVPHIYIKWSVRYNLYHIYNNNDNDIIIIIIIIIAAAAVVVVRVVVVSYLIFFSLNFSSLSQGLESLKLSIYFLTIQGFCMFCYC